MFSVSLLVLRSVLLVFFLLGGDVFCFVCYHLFLYLSWGLSLLILLLLAYCVSTGVCVIQTPPGGNPCDCIVHVIFGVPLNYSDECVHYFFAWEFNFFKQKKYVFLPQNIDLSLSGVKCSRIFVMKPNSTSLFRRWKGA